MSRRLQVTLPNPAADALSQLAHDADQPPGRLAGVLLQKAITQARRSGPPATPPLPHQHNRSTRPGPANSETSDSTNTTDAGERPAWLPPYQDDHSWRSLTWGAIAALHARYPTQLDALQENWWTDNDLLERLSALAHWRGQLDEQATDPREELYFHDALATLARHLAQQPGTHPRWDPNLIPKDWSR